MGNYAYIMLQKYHVRKEMIERIKKDIPSSELTFITMTSENKTDFDWHETNEFKYKGVMYDVVKSETLDSGETIFYCLADHLEMKLLAQLQKQKDQNSNQDKNSPKKDVIKLLFKEEISKHQQVVVVDSKSSVNIKPVNFYDSQIPEISSPPPNYM